MEQDMATSFEDAGTGVPGRNGIPFSRRDLLALAVLGLASSASRVALAAAPQGQLTWGVHVSLAPTWFDPAETPGIITPFMVLYALHDAMVKPMPGQPMAASLAESWSASEDALIYEFVLREGLKFHNGEPVTAEDVKFSFERYRGTSHDLMKARVAAVEAVDARHVRFKLKEPWPDFMVFYATATGAGQWDEKYPRHDERVGRAASLAMDRDSINQALTLRYSRLTGNPCVANSFDVYWEPPKPVYDPKQAKQLLSQAGHPNGFDAGEYYCDASYANLGETIVNNLREVGIRARLQPLERAAFFKGYAEKKYRNLIQGGSGAFGNATTRLEQMAVKGGMYAYGSYPDLDEMFKQQGAELDQKKRGTILEKMQQTVYERTIYAPIWQLAFINGHGPRVAESGFGLIPGFAYTGPYEDITLKSG